jgi:hypothetical protein
MLQITMCLYTTCEWVTLYFNLKKTNYTLH